MHRLKRAGVRELKISLRGRIHCRNRTKVLSHRATNHTTLPAATHCGQLSQKQHTVANYTPIETYSMTHCRLLSGVKQRTSLGKW